MSRPGRRAPRALAGANRPRPNATDSVTSPPNPTVRRPSRGSLAARLLALLASLALTAVLVEVGARVYLHRFADEESFLRYASLTELDERLLAKGRQGAERRYTPHRYLGYIPTPGYREGENRHNALGYRGDEIPVPKPAGEFRIACLGGSTTYTGAVEDYRRAYPQLLEKELHARGRPFVRVINAGGESWTSWESLVNLEFRLLDLEPDLIVDYDGINDVHARLVWPPRAYRGDNSGRRIPNISELTIPSLAEYSTFLRILLVRAGRIAPHADLSRNIDRAPETWRAPGLWRQWRDGSYPSGVFQRVGLGRIFEENPPVFFRRNLESLVAVARAHGARTVLATVTVSPAFDDAIGASPEYLQALAEMNDVMRQVAEETGAHLFDFAAVMPNGRRYFADSEHVNERGSALKARLFADELVEHGLVPEASEAPDAR